MIAIKQKNQGWRLLSALIVLLIVVPAIMVCLLVAGIITLELAWHGKEAAWALLKNWSRPSARGRDPIFVAFVAVVAVISTGVPVAVWHRIFIAGDYISKETQADLEKGVLPGVGRSLQPFILAGVIWLCFWATYRTFTEERYIDATIYGFLGGWCLYKSGRALHEWLKAYKQEQ